MRLKTLVFGSLALATLGACGLKNSTQARAIVAKEANLKSVAITPDSSRHSIFAQESVNVLHLYHNGCTNETAVQDRGDGRLVISRGCTAAISRYCQSEWGLAFGFAQEVALPEIGFVCANGTYVPTSDEQLTEMNAFFNAKNLGNIIGYDKVTDSAANNLCRTLGHSGASAIVETNSPNEGVGCSADGKTIATTLKVLATYHNGCNADTIGGINREWPWACRAAAHRFCKDLDENFQGGLISQIHLQLPEVDVDCTL